MQRSTYPTFATAILLFMTIMAESCVDDDQDVIDPCSDAVYSYQTDVKPIVEAKCAITDCHNGSLGPERNWAVFSTFQAKALSGDISHMVKSGQMPPASSPEGGLTKDQINAIACWAEAGAQNN